MSEEIGQWLEEFRKRNGRPLRVLHYGNIANNAYLNAKFLRRAGVDVDVCCGELYHVMASAEWEDVDVVKNYGDDYAPDFSAQVVGDYGRPNWFFQGPLRLAVTYFSTLNSLRPARLQYQQQRELQREVEASKRFLILRAVWRRSLAQLRALRLNAVANYLASKALPLASAVFGLGGDGGSKGQKAPSEAEIRRDFSAFSDRLIAEFRQAFPERLDQLDWVDLQPYSRDFMLLRQLFSSYDIVQAYSTDPILPMIAGFEKYVAFEHGTLRDFIRQDLGYHRLTALAYRKSAHVFVTNGDCFQHAEWLGCTNYSPMIHPIDVEQHRQRDEAAIAELRAHYDADVILFCPLRHDWSVKGTNVHLEALPKIAEKVGRRIALILTPWGEQVEQSRALIRSLGCEHMVRWLDRPLARPSMVRYIQAADVVLDQIALPHFGATAPQALAAGTPVVMSYQHESVERIVTEPAPILPAFTSDDVAEAVSMALDQAWRQDFQDRARHWIHTQHHPDRIVRDHLNVYRRILGE